MKIFPGLALGFSLILSACSLNRIALHTTVHLLDQAADSFYEENDPEFAESSMVSQLKLAEILLKKDPYNKSLVVQAVQGFGGYAFLFLEAKDPERASRFYVRGRDIGLKLLDKKSGFDILMGNPEQLDLFLKKCSRRDVPLLFWSAYNWGNLINLHRDRSEYLAQFSRVEQMMQRILDLDSDYFYNGTGLFFGTYYSSLPPMLGGNYPKSKQFFEEALSKTERKFLFALVLYARTYGVATQNKDLFQSLLKEVLDFNVESFPEQRLSNLIAQKQAKLLLENTHELFE